MSIKYQFNSMDEAEVSYFLEKQLRIKPRYKTLKQEPASSMGSLMQASINMESIDSFLKVVEKKEKTKAWSTLTGCFV